jgi:hypothetical protein
MMLFLDLVSLGGNLGEHAEKSMNNLKSKTDLNYIFRFSSYRAVNTSLLDYSNESFVAI